MTDGRSRVIASIGLLKDVVQNPLSGLDAPLKPKRRVLFEHLMHKALRNRERNSWALLEGIVVFDEIGFDAYAYAKYNMEPVLRKRIDFLRGHGLVEKTWPLEVYQKTAAKISRGVQLLNDGRVYSLAVEIPRDPTQPYAPANNMFWDAEDKDYHDRLFSQPSEISRYSFASSNEVDAFGRALFYAELTTALKVGFLGRTYTATGDTLFDGIGRSYLQCAHHKVLEKIEKFDELIRKAELRLHYPPLAQKIASLSLKTGCAPIEIAAELRDTKHAVAYRKFLGALQAELNENSHSTLNNLKSLADELEAITKRWIEDHSTGEGVNYQRREISVKWLPPLAAVGTYLLTGKLEDSFEVGIAGEFIEAYLKDDKISVRDPILWGGEKYLSFIASWYDNP
jgi:hypothetical protein